MTVSWLVICYRNLDGSDISLGIQSSFIYGMSTFHFAIHILTIHPLPPSNSPGKTSEILYGVENAVGRGVYFMSNVKERMDI